MYKISDVILKAEQFDRDIGAYDNETPKNGTMLVAEIAGCAYESIDILYEIIDLIFYAKYADERNFYLPADERQQLLDGAAHFIVSFDGGNKVFATLTAALQYIVDLANNA